MDGGVCGGLSSAPIVEMIDITDRAVLWQKYLTSNTNQSDGINTLKFNSDNTKVVAGGYFMISGSGTGPMIFILDAVTGAI